MVFCIVLWSSCRNDFDTVPNSGNLEFSQDTIYLDTVFTNIGSSTRTLKVFNRSSEDLNIPNIELLCKMCELMHLAVHRVCFLRLENLSLYHRQGL